MKKTRINFGAILLIAYAVMNYAFMSMLASDYLSPFLTLNNDVLDTLRSAVSSCKLVTFVIIGFSIPLLFGKKWGAIGIGASMAGISLINFVKPITNLGSLIVSGEKFSWEQFLSSVSLLIFVFVPLVVGWLAFGAAGFFSENKQGGRSILALICKIVSAILIVFSSSSQSIQLFNKMAKGRTFAEVFTKLIIPDGILFVTYAIMILILAVGMILSVKCLEKAKVEKKVEAVTEA